MADPIQRSSRVLACVWAMLAVAAPLLFLQPDSGSELQAQNDNIEKGDKAAADFKPRRVVPPFPAIKDAPFIPASEVTDEVSDNELVLGLVINDAARAYPINMLTGPRREIINDTLGGRAIAATW